MRLVLCAVLVAACSEAPVPASVRDERRYTGTNQWRLDMPALAGEIEGYTGQPAYASGDDISVAVSTSEPHPFDWQVFRMGAYGEYQARFVTEGGPLEGQTQAAPTLDPVTGLVEAHWAPSFIIATADHLGAWTTGVYLVQLTRDDGPQAYVIFILRDDSRDAEVAVQLSTNTWQAYNRWGGESLYYSESGLEGGKARVVSFQRPYAAELGFGSGTFLNHELPFVTWIEAAGYDVEYLSNHDVGGLGAHLGEHRVFVAVGHDEYETRDGIERLTQALADGVSLVYLTGNTYYWQVRFDPSGRLMTCYKDYPQDDPLYGVDDRHVTTAFRRPPVDWPENTFLGVISSGDAIDTPTDWVVHNAGHWIYDGAGVGEGSIIPGVVGFEWDGLLDNGAAPEGVTVVAGGPVPGSVYPHNATIYERGDAFLFAAGTIWFSLGLATEPAIDRVMRNVLARAGAEPH